jgi:polysaccharide export outer membrane protein
MLEMLSQFSAMRVLLFVITFMLTSFAHAAEPTAAQIEQFKKLSPSEQQSLAKTFGVDLPAQVQSSSRSVSPSPYPTPRPRPEQDSEQSPFPEDEEQAEADQKKSPLKKTTLNKNKTFADAAAKGLLDGPEEAIDQTEADDDQNDADQADAKKDKDSNDKDEGTLKPFGYDLFANSPTTFAPANDLAVPVDYVLGPGDTLVVQLYGKENTTQELTVNREGSIQFPQLGPMVVNGLKFDEFKNQIDSLVAEKMIGVKANVTMGALRSIQVFVLGEAYRPGAYTISALSTMTNALFACGGIKDIGSLRDIQLKRGGELIGNLDLYDLLLRGDTAADQRLQPGDVLFIPPVGKTVGVSGEVRRPAIYEVNASTTAELLVDLAGGFQPSAYPSASRVERISAKGDRTVIDVDLKSTSGRNFNVKNGDTLVVYSVLDKLENVVVMNGHVHRPGYFNWRADLRIADVVGNISDLKPNPDLKTALLKREIGSERLLAFELVDLAAALRRESFANRYLKPRDELIVFGASDDARGKSLKKFIDTLQLQGTRAQPANVVSVMGNVKAAGKYPLTPNMTAKQLIGLAGGLEPDAQQNHAIVAQKDSVTGRYTFVQLSLVEGAPRYDLQAQDQLFVLSNTEDRLALFEDILQDVQSYSWQGAATPIVVIGGAVRFPGTYPYAEGSRVQDLIEMAGGLKEQAYLLSGELTRRIVDSEQEFHIEHHIIELKDQQAINQVLQPRDQVVIQQIPSWNENKMVKVQGEVRFPGEYPISNGETLAQVLERAGGLTEHADAKGAMFLRQSLKEKEAEALERYKSQLDQEVTQLEKEAASNDNKLADQKAVGAKLLSQVEKAAPMGRLVIDLPGLLQLTPDQRSVASQNVILRDGDQLVVPTQIQEVSILGEVQYATSHLYVKKLNAHDYLSKSGGVTRIGDQKRAYIISRDGNVKPISKRVLFFRSSNKIEPGDTIIVPMDIDRVSPMVYWTSVSQILFQLATTAASLKTVGAI